MTNAINGTGTQQIPHSQEAEEAALGAALVAPGRAEDILAAAAPDDYFILRHKYIRQALEKCLEIHKTLDYLLVVNTLREMGKLDEIGGPAYLTQLINATPDSTNGAAYAQLVKRAATRRQIMAASDQWKAQALDENKSVEDLIAFAERAIADIAESSPLDSIYHIRDMMHTVWDNLDARIEERAAGGAGLVGLPTGLASLDEMLNGFRRNKLYLVGGRPGMGKTTLLIFFMLVIANLKPKPDGTPYRVYMWSGEMDEEEIGLRVLASQSEIEESLIVNGMLSTGQIKTTKDAMGALSKLNIHVDTSTRMTPRKLRRNMRKAARAGGGLFDIALVDYAQLMHGDGDFNKNPVAELENISRGLKETARALHIPVLSAVQLNRNVENREDNRPKMSDFKGSGSFEQDADVILFPYFEPYYTNQASTAGPLDIIVAKNRGSGKLGIVPTWVNFAKVDYTEDLRQPTI